MFTKSCFRPVLKKTSSVDLKQTTVKKPTEADALPVEQAPFVPTVDFRPISEEVHKVIKSKDIASIIIDYINFGRWDLVEQKTAEYPEYLCVLIIKAIDETDVKLLGSKLYQDFLYKLSVEDYNEILLVAVKSNNKNIIDLVGSRIATSKSFNILTWAVCSDHLDLVKELIKNGWDINEKDKKNYTGLMLAVLKDKTAICKFLLENRADVNIKNAEGKTALHIALDNGNIELITLLLDNDANIEKDDKKINANLAQGLQFYKDNKVFRSDLVKFKNKLLARIDLLQKVHDDCKKFADNLNKTGNEFEIKLGDLIIKEVLTKIQNYLNKYSQLELSEDKPDSLVSLYKVKASGLSKEFEEQQNDIKQALKNIADELLDSDSIKFASWQNNITNFVGLLMETVCSGGEDFVPKGILAETDILEIKKIDRQNKKGKKHFLVMQTKISNDLFEKQFVQLYGDTEANITNKKNAIIKELNELLQNYEFIQTKIKALNDEDDKILIEQLAKLPIKKINDDLLKLKEISDSWQSNPTKKSELFAFSEKLAEQKKLVMEILPFLQVKNLQNLITSKIEECLNQQFRTANKFLNESKDKLQSLAEDVKWRKTLNRYIDTYQKLIQDFKDQISYAIQCADNLSAELQKNPPSSPSVLSTLVANCSCVISMLDGLNVNLNLQVDKINTTIAINEPKVINESKKKKSKSTRENQAQNSAAADEHKATSDKTDRSIVAEPESTFVPILKEAEDDSKALTGSSTSPLTNSNVTPTASSSPTGAIVEIIPYGRDKVLAAEAYAAICPKDKLLLVSVKAKQAKISDILLQLQDLRAISETKKHTLILALLAQMQQIFITLDAASEPMLLAKIFGVQTKDIYWLKTLRTLFVHVITTQLQLVLTKPEKLIDFCTSFQEVIAAISAEKIATKSLMDCELVKEVLPLINSNNYLLLDFGAAKPKERRFFKEQKSSFYNIQINHALNKLGKLLDDKAELTATPAAQEIFADAIWAQKFALGELMKDYSFQHYYDFFLDKRVKLNDLYVIPIDALNISNYNLKKIIFAPDFLDQVAADAGFTFLNSAIEFRNIAAHQIGDIALKTPVIDFTQRDLANARAFLCIRLDADLEQNYPKKVVAAESTRTVLGEVNQFTFFGGLPLPKPPEHYTKPHFYQ